MAAAIGFYAGEGFVVNDLAGRALGGYGQGGYGTPVEVGQYQRNTYITNGAGTASDSVKVDNCRFIDANTVEIAGGEQIPLRRLPNYLATFEIRFTNDTPVKTQNPKLKMFNRVDQAISPPNVTTKVALIVHPHTTQLPDGTGSLTWFTPTADNVMNFGDIAAAAISPGANGESPDGVNTSSAIHQWYVAMSWMPITVGSKTFATAFSVEFI